jgi:GT2 family glycosyltransferase
VDAVAQHLGHGLDVLGGRVLLHDPNDLPLTILTSPQAADYGSGTFVPPGRIIGACLAIHRALFVELGGFDTRLGAGSSFRSGEDYDLLLRVAARRGTLGYRPDAVVRHHHGRRDPADAHELGRGYMRGNGACFAKALRRAGLRTQTASFVVRRWFRLLRQREISALYSEARGFWDLWWYPGQPTIQMRHTPRSS